ncbi:MAG: RNA methyltransferase PUA domain-containing protein [Coprococcus sp.]
MNHIKNVLRLKIGEEILVSDKRPGLYLQDIAYRS